jgi:ribosome biogenesis GTPase A
MARGQKRLFEIISNLDALVEIRDARAPGLTASPLSERLAAMKPTVIVLSRRDLADESKTLKWLESLKAKALPALAYNFRQDRFDQLKTLLNPYKPVHRDLRLGVVGIPNVGKSLFLNGLVGRNASRVGALPGITRGVEWFRGLGLLVVDSPGILGARTGLKVGTALSWLGCNRADVISSHETSAVSLIAFLGKNSFWPAVERTWSVPFDEEGPEATLEALGRRLGCLVTGGAVDLKAASRKFLESFSTGRLGRFTLELPSAPLKEEDFP